MTITDKETGNEKMVTLHSGVGSTSYVMHANFSLCFRHINKIFCSVTNKILFTFHEAKRMTCNVSLRQSF